jgi:GT2 family glycosyltransferase
VLGPTLMSDSGPASAPRSDERGGGPVELSVIIAARNPGEELAQQLGALVAQSWDGDWEVVVADNGSTDETVSIVERFSRSNPHVRVVDAGQVRGAGHARNVAVRSSGAASIAFCDADDLVQPGWVAAMGSALRRQDCVGGRVKVDLLNPTWLQTAFYSEPPDRLERFAGIFPFAATCNLGVRREVIDRVGGFDESFLTGQDIEFCLRMWAAGYELHYAPDAAVQYRYRPSLSSLFHRSRSYGAVGPAVARRLREMGAPTPSPLRGLKNYVWLLRRLPMLRTKQGRARWLVVAGGALGRAIGSIKYRHLYL